MSYLFNYVPSVGFEPTSLATYAPEAYAYSSSATRAFDYILQYFNYFV